MDKGAEDMADVSDAAKKDMQVLQHLYGYFQDLRDEASEAFNVALYTVLQEYRRVKCNAADPEIHSRKWHGHECLWPSGENDMTMPVMEDHMREQWREYLAERAMPPLGSP